MIALLFWLNVCFSMLNFSEGIVSHISLPYFFLISGNTPLKVFFVLKSKNVLTNFVIALMYYQGIIYLWWMLHRI